MPAASCGHRAGVDRVARLSLTTRSAYGPMETVDALKDEGPRPDPAAGRHHPPGHAEDTGLRPEDVTTVGLVPDASIASSPPRSPAASRTRKPPIIGKVPVPYDIARRA